MHTATITIGDGIVNLYAHAVPSIAAGSVVYAQNISNVEVDIGDNATLAGGALIMGTKINQNATSVMNFKATDTPFARSQNGRAVVTLHVE